MYYVTSNGQTFPVDGLEYVTHCDGKYYPIRKEGAHGFRTLIIHRDASAESHYKINVYVLPGHTMYGTEPEGTAEYRSDSDPEPDEGDEAVSIIQMIEEIL
jgi:hypothetical protein